MGDDVLEAPEPESADLREHRALVRDRLAHHDVEGAHPIGGYEQQPLRIHLVNVAHLATTDLLERQRARGHERHTRSASDAEASRSCLENGLNHLAQKLLHLLGRAARKSLGRHQILHVGGRECELRIGLQPLEQIVAQARRP